MNWRGTHRIWLAAVVAATAVLVAEPLYAQQIDGLAPPTPPADIPDVAPAPAGQPGTGPLRLVGPNGTVQTLPNSATSFAPSTLPAVEAKPLQTIVPRAATLSLSAKLTADGPPIKAGLVWRVFSETQGKDGRRELVAESHGGPAEFALKAGGYFVYCGFGYAGTTDHVVVKDGLRTDTVVLNAGGARLNAVTGKDHPQLSKDELSFDIYSQELDGHGEPKPVALDVAPGEIVRLSAQTYNVVANYGDANARTSADVEVKPGKLSEITLTEKAAKLTFKLVSVEGGEAIANTHWSILTQAGDLVTSGVGAFPSFVLAEGDYTVIANHEDGQFQRVVTVVSGENADVEVIAGSAQKATN